MFAISGRGASIPYGTSLRHRRTRAVNSDFSSFEGYVNTLQRLKPGVLRKELDKLGIKHEDCFEKEELVRRLATAVVSLTSSKNNDNVQPVVVNDNVQPLVCMEMKFLQSDSYSPAVKEDIIVPLTIQGRTYNFLIDTGSTTTLIRPEIAWTDLRISKSSATRSAGVGATAPFQDAPAVVLDPVELQACKCRPVQAVVIDLSTNVHPSAAGIIGMNMLSQFDVEFNFIEKKLAFHEAGAFQRHNSLTRDTEQLISSSGTFYVPYIQVQVGASSSPQPAILDLGSSLCVASRAAAQAAGAAENRRELLGGFGIKGNTTMPFYSSSLSLTFPTVNRTDQPLQVKDAKFAVGDLPVMNIMAAQLILGLNAFRRSKLLLSMSTRSTYLKLSANKL